MTMKEALARQLAEVGVVLVEMEVTEEIVVAHVDETLAAEPLCPLAFDRVVQALSWSLLGARLPGRFVIEEPTAEPAPVRTPERRAA